jgi:hypothetical protein
MACQAHVSFTFEIAFIHRTVNRARAFRNVKPGETSFRTARAFSCKTSGTSVTRRVAGSTYIAVFVKAIRASRSAVSIEME